MENQIQKPTSPINALSTMLNGTGMKKLIEQSVGKNADNFISSLIELTTGDKSLQTCPPQALIKEALRAATMKLPLNKALGFAYIVVYNSKNNGPTPTFIPGYKGYIQLALRTGQYKAINADCVYEGEFKGQNKLTGDIDLSGERTSDKVVGYFAYIEFVNGFSHTLYMSVEEMAKYAKRFSKGINYQTTTEQLIAKANDGFIGQKVGWEGNFNAMAVKTVLRRLISKYGYLSVDMQNALAGEINSESHDGAAADEPQKVNIEDAKFEDVTAAPQGVDPETGEVLDTPAAASDDEAGF